MKMLKRTRMVIAASVCGVALGLAGSASAATNAEESSAILYWPKVFVDTGAVFGPATDTQITLSNNSTSNLKQAHCFYINSTGHCQNSPSQACRTADDCSASACIPGWNESDFNVFITADQPLGWLASDGLQRGSFPIEGPGTCSNSPLICFNNAQCGAGTCQIGPNGQNNLGSGIPPVPEDPFIGSLICIQFDPTQNPPAPDQSATTNALIGEAELIVELEDDGADIARYNAVGLAATGSGNGDNSLALDGSEYEGCSQTLILDHFFDGAVDPVSVGNGTNSNNGEASTQLTLVPCGNDLSARGPGSAIAQFLVFNEFEQRFSASETVDCLLDRQISNLDTSDNDRSIFSAGVAGTLVGQTRIRGVGDAATGNGLTGVAVLSFEGDVGPRSSAYGLSQSGEADSGDTITIP